MSFHRTKCLTAFHIVGFMVVASFIASPVVASDEAVQIRLFEDQSEANWLAPEGVPTFSYTEPAFGFTRIPVSFTSNALPLDRSWPFSLEATMTTVLEAGEYQFRLRSRALAVFAVDGKSLLQTKALAPNTASHEALPEAPADLGPVRALHAPHQDALVTLHLDAGEHTFRLVAVIGGKGLSPTPGELSVSMARPGEIDRLIGGEDAPLLTDAGWEGFAMAQDLRHERDDIARRRASDAAVEKAWAERHAKIRTWMESRPGPTVPDVANGDSMFNEVDRFINAKLADASIEPLPWTSDTEFLRRLSLDTTGLVPSEKQIETFLSEPAELRRATAIERFLSDDSWADSWIPYWQDVLAENPGILKPDLNNTGPFRWYLHQALSDGYSYDRIAVELVEMEGSLAKGAPAGFSMASLNDAPMAAKADILSQAFLANKLSCARCHDAPFHPFKQKDLFSMAAMLEGKPIVLPESSTVPVREGGRQPFVKITLKAGESIDPHWPFKDVMRDIIVAAPPRNTSVDSRYALASTMVSPANTRFQRVIVNRVWARFMGAGIVDSLGDWSKATPTHPELLDYLAREFVINGYDLKHISRLILSSHTYQRQPDPADPKSPGEAGALFAGPRRRYMSAEQVVDSLHLVAGKSLDSEELNLNPRGDRALRQFLNMGTPERAWEATALSNERDRPSLALPRAQAIVDLLSAYGWQQSRQGPSSSRDDGPSPMQTLALANGATGTRGVRLSDDSYFTHLTLQDRSLDEMIDTVFLRALTRQPTDAERAMMVDYLEPYFADRVVPLADRDIGLAKRKKTDSRVSWANHFDPESTRIRMEEERNVRMGDLPTGSLTTEFREHFEDVVWAIVNSPEFTTIP